MGALRQITNTLCRPFLLWTPEWLLLLDELDGARRVGRKISPEASAAIAEAAEEIAALGLPPPVDAETASREWWASRRRARGEGPATDSRDAEDGTRGPAIELTGPVGKDE